jgi:hypothetical protein
VRVSRGFSPALEFFLTTRPTALVPSHSGPFGSHVLEKLLEALAAAATGAAVDADTAAQAEEALSSFVDATAASLYHMATHKYGSFVSRRLLCVLCGRDVAPAHPKHGGAPAETPEAGGEGTRARPARGGGPATGLAAKLQTDDGAGAGAQAAPFPSLLQRLAEVPLSEDWDGEVAALRCDQHAGPFLQALLRACADFP